MSRRKNTTGIHDFEIDSLARALLPAIQTTLQPKKDKESLRRGKPKGNKNN